MDRIGSLSHGAWLRCVSVFLVLFATSARAQTLPAPQPGENINMVSGTSWPDGDPFFQRQNEPSLAVSTRNNAHLLAAANDYRTVDLAAPPGYDGAPNHDAWLGVFRSIDSGMTWKSTLVPGYEQQQLGTEGYPNDALRKPVHIGSDPYTTSSGSDPVVRAGPEGSFYLTGLAFDRNSGVGRIFVATYVDTNDGSNTPVRYVETNVVRTGTPSSSVDKPWIAVDLAKTTKTCTFSVPAAYPTSTKQLSLTVKAQTLYVAWAEFYKNPNVAPPGNRRSRIMFSYSNLCGRGWSTPVELSEPDTLNQGATIAVDPVNSTVYVAWRRASTTATTGSAILVARSETLGKNFSRALVSSIQYPFDHDEPPGSFRFRALAYPTIAVSTNGKRSVDGKSWVHIAWAQRWNSALADPRTDPYAEGRIVMMTSPNGSYWDPATLRPVDDTPLTVNGRQFSHGHQFMPALTFTQGRLMLVYYDTRLDHTVRYLDMFQGLQEVLGPAYLLGQTPVAEILGWSESPAALSFVDEIQPQHSIAHTIEVRTGVAAAGLSPTFSTTRLSRYPFGVTRVEAANGGRAPSFDPANDLQVSCPENQSCNGQGPGTTLLLQQLQFNSPNLPMFAGGTVPFIGDYIDIAGPMFQQTSSGAWDFNDVPSTAPVHHAVWTSNQDVRPPRDGDWTHYKAPAVFDASGNLITTSTFTGVKGARDACTSDDDMRDMKTRDQNIYTSRIVEGLALTTPQNVKDLSQPRTFALSIRNATPTGMWVKLTSAVSPSADLGIRFVDEKGVRSVDALIAIDAFSTAAHELSVPKLSSLQTIYVTATEFGGDPSATPRQASITINPPGTDPTPWLGITGGTDAYAGSFSEPSLSDAGLTFQNPSYYTPSYYTPSYYTPSYYTPSYYTPSYYTPSYYTPSYYTASYYTPSYYTPSYYTVGYYNTAIGEATYLFNSTGSDSTFDLNLQVSGSLQPGTQVQVIVSKSAGEFLPVPYQCQVGGTLQEHFLTYGANDTTSQSAQMSGATSAGVTTLSFPNLSFSLGRNDFALVRVRAMLNGVPLTKEELGALLGIVRPKVTIRGGGTDSPPVVLAPALQSITFQSFPTTKTYGDEDFTVTATGGGSGNPVTFSVPATPASTCTVTAAGTVHITGAGSCTVTASQAGSAGYSAATPVSITFTISPKTASVTANAATKTYGQADPPFTGALIGFLTADNVSATYARTPGETVAGSPYTISATLGPTAVLANYDITYRTAQFTITPKAATVTPNAASKTYGAADPTLTGSLIGFLAADNVTVTYARTAGETVDGSPYTITATLNPAAVLTNYDVTYATASFTITKKGASVTPSAAAKTYGDVDPALTGTLSGFLDADHVSATYTRAHAGEPTATAEAVGTYLISASLTPAAVLGNYSITYNTAQLTITPRPASVSPYAATKVYGSPDPALIGQVEGFLLADAVLATYARTSGETVAGSPYTISATLSPAAVLANYSITYNTAAFTITAKAASVTPNPASKTYGAADPAFTGTLSGFLAADNVSATYVRTPGETVAGSPYTISATLNPVDVLTNYDISHSTAEFTIRQAAQSVTFGPLPAKMLGDLDFTVKATATSGLTVTFTSQTSATCTVTTAGSVHLVAGGTCTIRASQQGDTNYAAATPVDQSFTITSTYDFNGFLSPLYTAQLFTSSTYASYSGSQKYGRSVPFKFTVASNGTEVTATTVLRAAIAYSNTSADCQGLPTAGASQTGIYSPGSGFKGKSSFSYTSSGYFQFNWDTSVMAAAGCYTMALELSDGNVWATNVKLQ